MTKKNNHGGPRARTGKSSVGDIIKLNGKRYAIVEYLDQDQNVEHILAAPMKGDKPIWRGARYMAGVLHRTGERVEKPEPYEGRPIVYEDWAGRHTVNL